MKKSNIYLDYAAATPVDPVVLEKMYPYFSDKFYNPSAIYLNSQAVAKDINDARKQVACRLGSKPTEIIFTSGGTEANNLAIHGIMQSFPDANLIVSAIEHESVLEPARQFQNQILNVDNNGIIKFEEIEQQINDQTVLVSIMYANNEIGSVQPLRKISKIINKIRQNRLENNITLPLYFHTDAAQATAYLDLQVSGLGVDLMTVNGGKVYGPKQSGALFVKSGVKIKPQILGGGQELGYRSGTENVPSIIGFATALDLVQERRIAESRRLKTLQTDFISKILSSVKNVTINGSLKNRLPNNIHLTFAGVDNETLVMQLDELGIRVATGSACAAASSEPSHVLKAINLSDKEARSSVRITIGRHTVQSDLDKTVSVLVSLIS